MSLDARHPVLQSACLSSNKWDCSSCRQGSAVTSPSLHTSCWKTSAPSPYCHFNSFFLTRSQDKGFGFQLSPRRAL